MIDDVIRQVRAVYGGWGRDTSAATMRADWDALFESGVADSGIVAVSANGVAADWITAAGARTDRTLLYFHGGGYKIGSTRSHRDLMMRLSAAGQCRVLGVNYRLAPEHVFPAAVQDALSTYEWLLGQDLPAARLALAGDSAGGGLAAALLLALRERGLPMPAALVMLSAWTDLTAQGASYQTRAELDPIHQRAMILKAARTYLGAHGRADDPLASPLFGDLHALPPILMQVGGRETVLDDSTRFAAKAQDAGIEVQLEIYEEMIHVFQQFAHQLPDARRAIQSIGRFLDRVWERQA